MKFIEVAVPSTSGYQSPRIGWLSDNEQVVITSSSRYMYIRDVVISLSMDGKPPLFETIQKIMEGESIEIDGKKLKSYPLQECKLVAPLSHPNSIRDFYAFEQHVKTANENRGREVPKQWYEIPVFYFTNHTAIFGPGDVIPYPVGSEKLDYELEVAAVIGKQGRDIKPEGAEDYIFGYMIYNDWSARDIQAQEMAVGLGPAKGKDFAQSFGPYLVTPDELADRHTGRPGVYDLAMVARVNSKETSRGNWKDLHWSFGDMLARASAGVTLYPGDVIGSGTVGTGCLLEIMKGQGPYLQPGDVVELEIERLGILRNTVGEKQN
jgi:2-keto-4-pentenoate hydratase/2-oxohepta-3-ene-1,7-dioic acid hydratase in catechol pathway